MTATPPFTLLTADRVIDGTRAGRIDSAAVLLAGDEIRAIGRQADVRAPEGAAVERRDYRDATIVPGLVDAHTHLVAPGDGTPGDDVAREPDDILLLQAARNALTVLQSGVTTVRENGAKHRTAFALRDGIRRGLALGPRISICGRPITMTGGHMWYFGAEADGPWGVRVEVRRLLKEGADYIKIVASGGSTRGSNPYRASYTVEELRAITDEARRHGRLTAAHCNSTDSVANCLEAEVDMIIHCVFAEPDGRYEYRPELVDRLVAAGAWIQPTLHVARVGIQRLEQKRERTGALLPQETALLERHQRMLERRVAATGKMVEAGARVGAGSDSPWGYYPPGEFVHELEMLSQAGLSNADALIAGTSGAAESMGVGDQAGCLAAGRPADILVVEGDPLRDLGALWKVLDVYLHGRRVSR
jgi:imidazolonepropionase-like amidohydrolase